MKKKNTNNSPNRDPSERQSEEPDQPDSSTPSKILTDLFPPLGQGMFEKVSNTKPSNEETKEKNQNLISKKLPGENEKLAREDEANDPDKTKKEENQTSNSKRKQCRFFTNCSESESNDNESISNVTFTKKPETIDKTEELDNANANSLSDLTPRVEDKQASTNSAKPNKDNSSFKFFGSSQTTSSDKESKDENRPTETRKSEKQQHFFEKQMNTHELNTIKEEPENPDSDIINPNQNSSDQSDKNQNQQNIKRPPFFNPMSDSKANESEDWDQCNHKENREDLKDDDSVLNGSSINSSKLKESIQSLSNHEIQKESQELPPKTIEMKISKASLASSSETESISELTNNISQQPNESIVPFIRDTKSSMSMKESVEKIVTEPAKEPLRQSTEAQANEKVTETIRDSQHSKTPSITSKTGEKTPNFAKKGQPELELESEQVDNLSVQKEVKDEPKQNPKSKEEENKGKKNSKKKSKARKNSSDKKKENESQPQNEEKEIAKEPQSEPKKSNQPPKKNTNPKTPHPPPVSSEPVEQSKEENEVKEDIPIEKEPVEKADKDSIDNKEFDDVGNSLLSLPKSESVNITKKSLTWEHKELIEPQENQKESHQETPSIPVKQEPTLHPDSNSQKEENNIAPISKRRINLSEITDFKKFREALYSNMESKEGMKSPPIKEDSQSELKDHKEYMESIDKELKFSRDQTNLKNSNHSKDNHLKNSSTGSNKNDEYNLIEEKLSIPKKEEELIRKSLDKDFQNFKLSLKDQRLSYGSEQKQKDEKLEIPNPYFSEVKTKIAYDKSFHENFEGHLPLERREKSQVSKFLESKKPLLKQLVHPITDFLRSVDFSKQMIVSGGVDNDTLLALIQKSEERKEFIRRFSKDLFDN